MYVINHNDKILLVEEDQLQLLQFMTVMFSKRYVSSSNQDKWLTSWMS